VRRPRLADQLGEGLSLGLVLVAAPAGYGKSVLLAEWVRGLAQPVAWLSLDGGDNDPVRFWRHVLTALDTTRPGLAERVGPLAGPPPPPAHDALVSALINDVVADPDMPEVLLVLDDYHLISSDSVHSSVRFLLEHRPPQLRIVFAGRSDPPLGLARYRGRGELSEVRAADLRFNVDEAAELLRQVAADLDLPAVTALAERTEGWAAGLQLAALSLRSQPDIARSQEMLEEVDGSGLFVVQLDDIRGWWRYHHLFADLLRARLEQDPERARRLHRNAATWYERQGLPDDTPRPGRGRAGMGRPAGRREL
jgi:LuxR family transcriptional regulator, maltose regulon positive regulatory protein